MVLLLRDPQWWLNHPQDLRRALRDAARDEIDRADREGLVRWVGEREGHLDRPSTATIELPDGSVAISDPAWWAEHLDVLVDGLQRELEIEPQSEPLLDLDSGLAREDQERPDPEPLLDLDAALDRARQQRPDSERPRDRGIER